MSLALPAFRADRSPKCLPTAQQEFPQELAQQKEMVLPLCNGSIIRCRRRDSLYRRRMCLHGKLRFLHKHWGLHYEERAALPALKDVDSHLCVRLMV